MLDHCQFGAHCQAMLEHQCLVRYVAVFAAPGQHGHAVSRQSWLPSPPLR